MNAEREVFVFSKVAGIVYHFEEFRYLLLTTLVLKFKSQAAEYAIKVSLLVEVGDFLSVLCVLGQQLVCLFDLSVNELLDVLDVKIAVIALNVNLFSLELEKSLEFLGFITIGSAQLIKNALDLVLVI